MSELKKIKHCLGVGVFFANAVVAVPEFLGYTYIDSFRPKIIYKHNLLLQYFGVVQAVSIPMYLLYDLISSMFSSEEYVDCNK